MTSKFNLAMLSQRQQQHDRSEPLFREVVEGTRRKFGPDHPLTHQRIYHLVLCYEQQGQFARAEPLRREMVACVKKQTGPTSPQYLERLSDLGINLWTQKKYTEAEPLLLQTYEWMKRDEARFDRRQSSSQANRRALVQLYEATGKKEEAAKWRQKLGP